MLKAAWCKWEHWDHTHKSKIKIKRLGECKQMFCTFSWIPLSSWCSQSSMSKTFLLAIYPPEVLALTHCICREIYRKISERRPVLVIVFHGNGIWPLFYLFIFTLILFFRIFYSDYDLYNNKKSFQVLYRHTRLQALLMKVTWLAVICRSRSSSKLLNFLPFISNLSVYLCKILGLMIHGT